jgi:hypothetical protein
LKSNGGRNTDDVLPRRSADRHLHQSRTTGRFLIRTGPGQFLGGFNPGKPDSVHKPYVDTEAGINRVFVRASRTAGVMTLRATSSQLTAATATVPATALVVMAGVITAVASTPASAATIDNNAWYLGGILNRESQIT